MLKEKIESIFKESISKSLKSGTLGELKKVPDTIPIEITKNPEHGDKAISIAMKLTKEAKIAPRNIAQTIVDNLAQESFEKIDIAGPGFINLTLNWRILEDAIVEIHNLSKNYGKIAPNERPDKSYARPLIEYVSANPTGDLHLGHGRQAVLGSALAELLRWGGYTVSSEFYINDAGAQMEKLAHSCRQAIYIQEKLIPESEYDAENNYPLDSMLEFINPESYREFLEAQGSRLEAQGFSWDKPELEAELSRTPDGVFGYLAEQIFLQAQKEILAKVGTEFDVWFSERENLHKREDSEFHTKVTQTCQKLLELGYAYEEEGALWFKAEEFGDERNRVLKKSDGKFTYLAADYAYHLDKASRGYDKLINLWGADHHGQIPSMKGGLKVLGLDPEILEVILIQMVSLTKAGQEVKMSKRDGNFVTIKELAEEVGVDAFRYFLVESQANNRIIFDLELAKKQDKDNPVYYIQYAHARACSILKNLTREQIDQNTNQSDQAVLNQQELDKWLSSYKFNSNLFSSNFSSLSKEELASTKALVLELLNFPEELKEAVLNKAPYKIAVYLKSLAGLFHQFYTHNRVITGDKELMKARLSLVEASRIVLSNALKILGISAPQSM